MEHLAKPLSALAERMGAFITSLKVTVLSVSSDPRLRDDVCDIVLDFEWHAANTRPFYFVDLPFDESDVYWEAASNSLLGAYEHQRVAFGEQACSLPDLPQRPSASAPTQGLLRFAETIAALNAIFKDDGIPAEGIVVVLAPPAVATIADWRSDVARLVDMSVAVPSLRWVVIETSDFASDGWRPALNPERAWWLRCHIDEAARSRDIDRLLARSAAAASGKGFSAGAKPPGPLPLHPADPRGPAALPVLHLPPFIDAMRALNRGDVAAALPLVKESWRIASGQGTPVDAASMGTQYCSLLALAAMRIEPSSPTRAALAAEALYVLAATAKSAVDARLDAEAAQAYLAHAATAKALGDQPRAGASFRAAADHAKAARLPTVELFALSSAGELAAEHGAHDLAERTWLEALSSVREVPAGARGALAVPEHLAALAALAEKHGHRGFAQTVRATLVDEGAC